MNEVLLIGLLLLLLGAGIGLGILLTPSAGESERQRLARETWEAEREITEIGRQAQTLILQEALRRAQMKPTATRADRPDPWNDRG